MHKTEDGFSVFEILLVILIAGLIVFAGWHVREVVDTRAKKATKQIQKSSETSVVNNQQSTQYTFNELDISMELLPGWSVTKTSYDFEHFPNYKWEIRNFDADGGIYINSILVHGDLEACDTAGSLKPEKLLDVKPTRNNNLMIMIYNNSGVKDDARIVNVVRSDDAFYWAENDPKGIQIKNEDLKPGDYFVCNTYSNPYTAHLNLRKATPPVGNRLYDNIGAEAVYEEPSDSTPQVQGSVPDNKQLGGSLTTSNESYADILTMLMSIK